MQLILRSLIQGDFRGGPHGNFEAVVTTANSSGPLELWHWFRDNSDPALPWKRGQRITDGAAAGRSIIQSDFMSGGHGNFEVVVPLFAAGGMELWHFFHDNSDVNKPWQRAQRIATNIAGAGCIIQSDFRSGDHGNFEVVVPIVGAHGSIDLWHYWHDNSDVNKPWQQGQRVAANVAGPGTIIQSNFRSGDHGNFEVVVPIMTAGGTRELWHYWHDNSDVNKPWQRGQRVAPQVDGSADIIQSNFRSGDHGNFEVVVPVGGSLVHYWHDNSDVNKPWSRGQNITDVGRGWGSIIQSDYISDGHGNFEVLVPECSNSLIHYWHPNQDANLPWLRGNVVIGEPYPSRVIGAIKVAQLTGEYDRQGWNGQGTPPFAFNRTESRAGIRGCDLGISFEHANRAYFLFGDTWRINQTQAEQDLDSVAFTTDSDPTHGVHLTFNNRPPLVTPVINQHGFNVPVEGTSWNGAMYVFFTTDSYQIDGVTLMGRSILAHSADGGYNFTYLAELSRKKFINISVDQRRLDATASAMLGLPVGTQVLWMFGTGRYRASGVYLAVLPLTGIDHLQGLRYWVGGNQFSTNEGDAVALVCEGDVGELSARWNPFLERWLLLFNSGNPRGILLHSAPEPWGPWTQEPVMMFDPGARPGASPCDGAGYGKFMHVGYAVAHCDHVQDDMFAPGTFRDNDWGGEYGPYQITRYTKLTSNNEVEIWFTMSTWNPYQSMLMKTVVPRTL